MPRTIAALIAFVLFALPAFARADDTTPVDTRVVSVPNSPIALTRCQYSLWSGGLGYGPISFNVLNRTTYDALSLEVHVYYYDKSNSLMGEDTISQNLDEPLASGDTASYSPGNAGTNLNEPSSALGHATCRIQSASFTAHKHWHYGERWKGKLLPLQSSMIDAAGGSHSRFLANSGVHTKPNASLRVLAAWNDTSAGMTIVHDRIAITASSGPVTIKPIDVVLRMRMQNGQTLSLPALGTAAPTYMKFNPTSGSDEATPEVDPSTDLGALGSVTVPQGGTAVVVATFVIPGSAANPDDNKRVALR